MRRRSLTLLLLAAALAAGPALAEVLAEGKVKGGYYWQKAAPAGGYSGRKPTCRQIGSYARAQELLRQGHTYLDRGGDGVACESLR